jgi:hypothetical protein
VTREEKIKKVESVIRSCKTYEQVFSCINWIKAVQFSDSPLDTSRFGLWDLCGEVQEAMYFKSPTPESRVQDSKSLSSQVPD